MAEKEFYILSKPFLFPFKIADFVIMWSDANDYCFVNTDVGELEDELTNLNPDNVLLVNSIASCPSESKKICFTTFDDECDVLVQETQNKVTYYNDTGSQEVFYVESSDR